MSWRLPSVISKAQRVPGWLRRLALRGLSTRPEARYPSLDALLDVLARPPPERLGRRLALWGTLAAVAVGAFESYEAAQRKRTLCRGQEAVLAGVWDAKVQQQLARAFVGTGIASAADTWRRTRPILAAYSKNLVAARQEACEATHLQGTQPKDVLSLRMACFDRRLTALRALTEVLASPNADVLNKSVLRQHVDECLDLAQPLVEAAHSQLQRLFGLLAAHSRRLGFAQESGLPGGAHACSVRVQHLTGPRGGSTPDQSRRAPRPWRRTPWSHV